MCDKNPNNLYFPSKFNVYRQDRTLNNANMNMLGRSGGVALLVHSNLAGQRVKLIYDNDCECVAVKIELKPEPLVIVMYEKSVINYGYLFRKNSMFKKGLA